MTSQNLLFIGLICSLYCHACSAHTEIARKNNTRLLYAIEKGGSCDIRVWSPASGQHQQLAAPGNCPANLFMSRRGRSAFFVSDDTIRAFAVDQELSQQAAIQLPDMNYLNWQDQIDLKPYSRYLKRSSRTEMRPSAIGYLANGTLAMQAGLSMPWDDSLSYLFAYEDQSWSVVDVTWCSRLDESCEFEALDGYSAMDWNWQKGREVWHDNVKDNEFFVSERREVFDLKYVENQGTNIFRSFVIDGRNIQLAVTTHPSPHSYSPHTFQIELTINDRTPKILAARQCAAAIAGRYILVHQYGGGTLEVTDIGTGKSVLGPLLYAMWFD